MAFSREKLSVRQKGCLAIAILLVILGLFQVTSGAYTSVEATNEKCEGSKGMVIGAYLMMAGVSGTIGYFPRKIRNHCKQVPSYGRKETGSRSAVVVFIILCALVAVLVVVDSDALRCVVKAESNFQTDSDPISSILVLLEVINLHFAHLLCALSVGLAFPDLIFKGISSNPHVTSLDDSTSKLIKPADSSLKCKTPQALRLPDARTHVQEVPGTGEKVTVVTLPKTEGIIYAVPEEQYAIRRGEATYMAPSGNTKLAALFPTYTKLQAV